jgi:monoamine oxidase
MVQVLLGGGGVTLELTADSSSPSAKPVVLASFLSVDRFIRLGRDTPGQRRQVILRDLATCWEPSAAEPVDYSDKNWSEEHWVTGAFSTDVALGAWASVVRTWREPVAFTFDPTPQGPSCAELFSAASQISAA